MIAKARGTPSIYIEAHGLGLRDGMMMLEAASKKE
jgi:hypothetical protein